MMMLGSRQARMTLGSSSAKDKQACNGCMSALF